MRRPFVIALWLALLAMATPAPAQDAPAQPPLTYDSPRDAVITFKEAMRLIELGKGDRREAYRLLLATVEAEGLERNDALRRPRLLYRVLNQLGEVDDFDLPDHERVTERGITRYTLYSSADARFNWVRDELAEFTRWPVGGITLAMGDDGGWRFTAETLEGIDTLADSLAPLAPRVQEQDPLSESETEQYLGMLGQTFADTQWWQWAALAGCIFLGLVAGRLAGYSLRKIGTQLTDRGWRFRGIIFLNLASPASLALLTAGLMVGLKQFVQLDDKLVDFVDRVIGFLLLLSLGWFLYNLVDIVEVGLRALTGRTSNRLDDMVVPLVRKTLRIFLVVVFALVAAENIFGMDVTGFLAGLGIAGLAVSLAAQDSVKNLFGSLTIFFDKPFTVGDLIVFDNERGTVEEIGLRSTRIRLLSGHVVTVPNMKFTDNKVENISLRPYIRREMDVTITYDTPLDKITQAVEILRAILSDPQIVERGMFDMEAFPPRVSFSGLNADSLNIKAYYWYRLPRGYERDWFTYLEHCQLVNTMLFERYAEAGIDFAFPTQTLYLAGDPDRKLAVTVEQDRH